MITRELPLKNGGLVGIGKGRYFRVLKASYPITIRTYGANGTQEAEILANTGAEFEPFSRAEIFSEQDQNVVIAYSNLPIYDNRLGVDENTLLKLDAHRTATGLAELVAAGNNEVLTVPANPNRKSLIIQAGSANAAQIWAGGSAVGVGLPMNATDTLTIEVKEAFDLFAVNSGDKVHLLEVI